MMKMYLLVFARPTISTQAPSLAVQSKPLTHGILTGPVVLRENLVHHGHLGSVSGIGRTKRSSFENGQPQRVEVVLVHDRARNGRALLPGRELKAFRSNRDWTSPVHGRGRGERGRLDAGYEPGALGHLLEELLCLRIAVAHEAGVETHQEQVVRAIAGTGDQSLLKASIYERGHREQHHGTGDLSSDQQRAAPPPAPPEAGNLGRLITAVKSPRVARIAGARPNRKALTSATTRLTSNARRSSSNDVAIGRSVGIRNCLPQQHTGIADAKTDAAAEDRNQHALGDELADDPGTPGANGQPQGHFASPHRRTTRQKARDVATRDQQHGPREQGEHCEEACSPPGSARSWSGVRSVRRAFDCGSSRGTPVRDPSQSQTTRFAPPAASPRA